MALTRKGYDVISEEEYFKEIMNELKTEFPNMSENPSNLLVILARVLARNENHRDYDRVQGYSDAYIATATGMHLDKAVKTGGIYRLEGTKAVGKVKIIRDLTIPQIILPSGTEIKSGEQRYLTANTSAIVINTRECEVEVIAKDVGTDYNIGIDSKFITVLNIHGIKDITASTDILGGTNVESDASLRDRYYRRMSSFLNSSLKGILDAVYLVNGVNLVDGTENVNDTPANGLPPHSFKIFVSGGTERDIGKAIMYTKPAGIQSEGDITVSVDISGRPYDVKFSRFTDSTVYFNFEVLIDKTLTSPTFVDDFKNFVVDYTSTNTKITSYELSNFLSQNLKGIKGIKTIKFGLTPNPQTGDDLIAPAGQTFHTVASNITLKII